jgi:cytochrome c oxidase subunit 4
MVMTTQARAYKTYWLIWGVLLALTLVMIYIGESAMPQVAQALLLLAGSLTKATLILLYFMHLRYERSGLILTVIVGILVTGLLMFSLPAFDGTQMAPRLLVW